jgi:phage tail-like protein
MDANGTRFHLLLGRSDWGRCSIEGQPLSEAWDGQTGSAPELSWDAVRAEVSLRAELYRFIAGVGDQPPQLEDRRGAARDRYGNFYWIDRDRRTVKVLSSGSRRTSTFWPVAPEELPSPSGGAFGPVATPPPSEPPPPLSGLAVTDQHYLVVGTLEPAGLLVFDLHAGGPPLQYLWPALPESDAFAPWDIAAAPGGGVVVLDRKHLRLWYLDASFRAVRTDGEILLSPEVLDPFQPLDGSHVRRLAAETFPDPVALDASSSMSVTDPLSVEVLGDGRVLVLDRGPSDSRLWVYRNGAPDGPPVPLEVASIFQESDVSFSYPLLAHDMALMRGEGGTPDRLYVVGHEGNQAFVFELHDTQQGAFAAAPLPEYLPMRLFGGKGLIASGGQAFYDFSDGFIPLVTQRRPRFVPRATLRTPVLDGRTPDCVWHRLMLDAVIPPGATITVRSRAANELEGLQSVPFSEEPALLARASGSELPFVQPPQGSHRGTFEVLFQRAKGRYAQLELTLEGGGGTTPRIHALRAWYPRFSYAAQYLPAIYREDPESASFLDRFLANVEGLLTPLEDRIAAAQVLFDARSAPPEALDWLASWFGVVLDPGWDETRRRLFLRHTLDFFQWRGTPRGLRMALRLALDECVDDTLFMEDTDPTRARIRIVEKFRSARTPFLVPPPSSERDGIRVVAPAPRWEPRQGRAQLVSRYQDALREAKVAEADLPEDFPLRAPSDTAQAEVWRAFSRQVLGFVPAATSADTPLWREFLARRYRQVSAYNTAHVQNLTGFAQAALPTVLPLGEPAQVDWYHFETVVLPMRAAAHRFTVVLPVPVGGSAQEQRERLERALRIVELEKPAHTVFDVKFYWAMFRVGEARLGVDTLVDLGSRAPELMPAMQLGREYLAEGYLAPSPPQDAKDRRILGRDPLGRRETHGSDIQ